MTTFKLSKVNTHQSYQASDCGVSYTLNPVYQDNDDIHTETELVWIKEFEIPNGYSVKKRYITPDDPRDFDLALFDTSDDFMADEPVRIVNVNGRPAISKWGGGLLFLKEVAGED